MFACEYLYGQTCNFKFRVISNDLKKMLGFTIYIFKKKINNKKY